MRSATLFAALVAGFTVAPTLAAPAGMRSSTLRTKVRRQGLIDQNQQDAISQFEGSITGAGGQTCTNGVNPTTLQCNPEADSPPPAGDQTTEQPTDDQSTPQPEDDQATTEQPTNDQSTPQPEDGQNTEQPTDDQSTPQPDETGAGGDPFGQQLDDATIQAVQANIEATLSNQVQPTDDDIAAMQASLADGGPLDSYSITADDVAPYYWIAIAQVLVAQGYGPWAIWDLFLTSPCELGYPSCQVAQPDTDSSTGPPPEADGTQVQPDASQQDNTQQDDTQEDPNAAPPPSS